MDGTLLWRSINVYRAVVLTTLLYGAESWVTYCRHLHLIERYHQRCLRAILNIHWSDFVTNIDVFEMAQVTMLLKTQLRWAGHVSRMENHHLPKIVLYGELFTGHRDKGAPRKRYRDTLKRFLATCDIDYVSGQH